MTRPSGSAARLAGAGIVALALAGCGAPEMLVTHIGGDLKPSDFNYPVSNPHPAHMIAISGTVAPSLQLELAAVYLTDGSTSCRTTSSFIAGAVEGAVSPSAVRVPLPVSRDGESYSASVAVDRFAPGRCNWQFGYVTASLSKRGKSSQPTIILRARDGWNMRPVDTPAANAADTPVVLYCWRTRQDQEYCGNRPKTAPGKVEHRYTDTTTRVVADFQDDDAGR